MPQWIKTVSRWKSIGVNQFGTVDIAMDCQLLGSEFDSCTELIYLILFFGLIKIHNIPFANKNAESISQEDTYIYTQYQ